MNNKWLWRQSWVVRDNTAIPKILDIGDTLTLEPNSVSGTPQFFLLHYTGRYTFWEGTAFYPVGITAPTITLHYPWDDSVPPAQQATGVCADYKIATDYLRNHANDPQIAKLLGYVMVEGHFAIISLFCFQNAQPDAKDWFAIDSQWSQITPRQDGTAHGDPP
jgi:hypothetical protein